MKRLLLAIIAAACLHAAPSFASYAIVTGAHCESASSMTCALSGSVATGNVIIVVVAGNATTVTDNVNTGSYSVLYNDTTDGTIIYWKTTNATGTPTVTISGMSFFCYANVFAITGFVGTPTSDVTIQNHASGSSTTVAINATSNHNDEFFIAGSYTSSQTAMTVPGWSNTQSSGTAWLAWAAIVPTSGTVNNFAGTFSPSSAWNIALAGVYDPSGPVFCNHTGMTSAGAIATPNGTTGSYRGSAGAFVTPDCSTVTYKQTQGAFGVN